MSSILTTARLVCKDTSSRTTVIAAFRAIIAYTAPHEPEVLQYVCALPVDDTLGTEIYMIEEYTNQAASDAHLATQPVQDLIKLFTTSNVLAGPPEVHNSIISSKKTAGSLLDITSNPAILLVNTPYEGGPSNSDLDGWKSDVQEAFGSVKGLGSVIVAEDREGKSVRAEYVFKGWEEFESFAAKGKKHGGRGGEAEIVKIKGVDGFLGREEGRSRL